MFAVQNAIRSAPRLLNVAAVQQRTIVSGPPKVRISLTEKIIHGVVLYVGIMAVPMYISVNIKHYRGDQE